MSIVRRSLRGARNGLVVGRRALRPAPAPAAGPPSEALLDRQDPLPAGALDVRELIGRYSVEELIETADEYYRANDNLPHYGAKPLATLEEAPDLLSSFAQLLLGLRALPGMKVLDFGTGTGWTSRFLAQLGCEVVGMDASATAIRAAEEILERWPLVGAAPTPTFRVFDGHHVDLPDASVDRITCVDTLHHVPNAAHVLGEFGRVLRDGGVAGFVEPGPNHSKMAQSQFEMQRYRVIENDILMHELWEAAQRAGFTGIELSVFSSQSFRVGLDDYEDVLRGGGAWARYHQHVLPFLEQRRLFFLTKGDAERADSRQRDGLDARLSASPARLSARPGEQVEIRVHARNTGRNLWLPSSSPRAPVLVGVHLLAADGRMLDRDYGRAPLPGDAGLPPGAEVDVPVRVAAPTEPGRYRLDLDLVAEHVAWFEMNGTQPASVELDVRQ